jgi:BTB/POZ domain
VRIVAKAKDLVLINSGFNNITAENFRQRTDNKCRDEVLNRLTPAGSLVLDVIITLKIVNAHPLQNSLYNPMIMFKEAANNHLSLLIDPQFSDFKFIVKGKEFKVHRGILAASSPVFTKMFSADMEEARKNECIVEDIEPEIFEHLLRFIYGGKLPENIGNVSMKLFEAAHYYEIKQLKKICKQQFPFVLKTENILEIFNWASVFDEDKLKIKAWEIIKR